MKKLIVAMCAAASFGALAAENKDAAKAAPEKNDAKANEAELEKTDAPIFWGFANYGFYSGYQLYGSIVNTEPTLQGYAEVNANLPWSVGPLDNLGYFGGGIWNNSDLTGKRDHKYRRAFNEFDFNVHWGKTFWFNDDRTWGITYLTSVVWYFYPHTTCGHNSAGERRPNTKTTMDWNHYFQLDNPYVIPYINVVHEYEQSDGNLLQFGVKKPFQITDDFSLCPIVEFVWRNSNYGWCFSNYGLDENWNKIGSCLATMKLELDATYMFTQNFGVFAKVAYCQNLDDNLRDACSNMCGNPENNPYGDAYGRYNEFCWGGVGLCVNF